MDIAGEQIISVPQSRVWDALNDPQILKACIPGCESIQLAAENQYKILMTVAVGPVKAKFTGDLTLSDIDAPHSYSLTFAGNGGVAGFGKGSAQVSLSPEGDGGTGTKLVYTASAQVGGKLAQVGSRLIDSVAKKMAEEFFGRFKATLTPVEEAGQPATEAVTVTMPTALDAGTPPVSGFKFTPLKIILIVLAASLGAYLLAS